MKKGDIYLIIVIMILVTVGIILTRYVHSGNASRVAVSIDNGEKEYYPLSENMEKVFYGEYGKNVLVIKDNTVYVKESDCKNQICVNTGAISKNGETIVCLPHRFVVTIVE